MATNRFSTTGWILRTALILVLLGAAAAPLRANVITDWDAKASGIASPAALGQRELAIVDLAMFEAVNSIAGRYPAKPKDARSEPASAQASQEAAAASAAATALAKLQPQ